MTHVPIYLATNLPSLDRRMALAMELGLGLQIDAICHGERLDEITTPLRIQLEAAALPWPVTVRGPIFHVSASRRVKLDFAIALQTAFGALAFAAGINASSVTFHTGFSAAWAWTGRLRDEAWLSDLTHFWFELLQLSRRCGIHPIVANLLEPDPRLLLHVSELLPATPPGTAFDLGHWNLSGRAHTFEDWVTALGPSLEEIHLSDNDGKRDQHLDLGSATTDFSPLWPYLEAHALDPPRLVVDVPTKDLRRSVEWLRNAMAKPGGIPLGKPAS